MFTLDEDGQAWLAEDDTGRRRRRRWLRRESVKRIARAWKYKDGYRSVLQPTTHCGYAVGEDVEIRVHRGRAFASGLKSCGKIWTCPTCSARIRARRQVELQAVAAAHVAAGGTLGMITLTIRHKKTMTIAETLDAVTESWKLVTNRSAWRSLRANCAGYVRALEITHGLNGWHPHLHVLLFLKPCFSDVEASVTSEALFTSWSEGAAQALGIAPTIERGFDFQFFGTDSAAAAAYVTKVAKELTFADSKSGRDPFVLLDNDLPTDEQDFIDYADATHRRKAITWSRGLREQFTSEPEQTDEDLAQENEKVGTYAATISKKLWNALDVVDRLNWFQFFEAHRFFSSS